MRGPDRSGGARTPSSRGAGRPGLTREARHCEEGAEGDRRSKPPFDLIVTDIALSGESYAEVKGETIYVDGAIPGEKVRVRIVARGQANALDRGGDGVAKAALVEVLEPSPHRVAPACPHASECGGCSFQHVAYEEQLRQKGRLLDGLLEDTFGPGKPVVSPMIGMPVDPDGVPRRFRQKAAFSFTEDQKGRL